jgi:YD repeat-containing protein
MGRIGGQTFQTPSLNGGWQQAFNLSYDLAGHVTSITYPDGRVVKSHYNNAGLLDTVTYDSWNGQPVGSTYYNVSTFWPNGVPATVNLGNGIAQTTHLNNRLQVDALSVGGAQTFMNLAFCMNESGVNGSNQCSSTTAPNSGNVGAVIDLLKPNNTQVFGYDRLSRISTGQQVNPSGFGQTYTIDPWGNLNQITHSKGTSTDLSAIVDPATNHLSGYTYDLA